MHILSGFADISVAQLLLVAIVALLAGIIGGISGYGSGALMPLVLVPMVGAAPVVPIIGLAALFNNFGRVSAYLKHLDRRRAAIGAGEPPEGGDRGKAKSRHGVLEA